MIVTRYIVKEITKTTLAVLVVLLCVAMSNEFVTQLGKAAAGELPASIVLTLVVAYLPSLLSMLLPLSFFLGVVFGLSRMYADSEMTAFLACGLNWRRLVKITMIPTLVVAAIALLLQAVVTPRSFAYQEEMLARAQSDLLSYALSPGQFQKSFDGKTILFAKSLSEDKKRAADIFVAELPNAEQDKPWRVTYGSSAKRWRDPKTKQEYIVVARGSRYEGDPGAANFSIIDFASYGIRLNQKIKAADFNIRAVPTSELWASEDPKAQQELQWRLTVPISILIVAWLALPLSVVAPRSGRYSSLLPAMVVVIIYSNLLLLTRSWLQDGALPLWLGYWWVHGLGLLCGGWLTMRQSGWWRRKFRATT